MVSRGVTVGVTVVKGYRYSKGILERYKKGSQGLAEGYTIDNC